MITPQLGDLQALLSRGLAVVQELWSYESETVLTDINSDNTFNDIKYDNTLHIYNDDQSDNIHMIICSINNYVYAYTKDANHIWTYKTYDRVRDVCIYDIDNDGSVEIIVGSEDRNVYVINANGTLRWRYFFPHKVVAVGHADVNNDMLHEILIECIDTYKYVFSYDGDMLRKYKGNDPIGAICMHDIDQLAKYDFLHLNRFLTSKTFSYDKSLPTISLPKIDRLLSDNDQELLITFILPILLYYDKKLFFQYLKHFSRNNNRYIRHAVVRILHQIIPNYTYNRSSQLSLSSRGGSNDPIFSILLQVALNKESEWTQQEASRTLALYLDSHHDKLIVAIYALIIKNIQTSLLEHIANNATTGVVKRTIHGFASLIAENLCLENVQEHLEEMVRVLEEVKNLPWGTECWIIYKQLQRLFAVQTIDEFAYYHALLLPELQELRDERPFREIRCVFRRLGLISRCLRIYIRHDSLNDRMSSLLEAGDAVNKIRKVIDHEVYNLNLFKETDLLPARRLFHILLDHWNTLIQDTQDTLRGKPELVLELQTRYIHFENPFGIWLQVKNAGRSTAYNVQINLCNSDTEIFRVISKQSFILDEILPGEETSVEFILQIVSTQLAQARKNGIELAFDMVFDDLVDPDGEYKHSEYHEHVLFTKDSYDSQEREFHEIDSPYIIGLPAHNPNIFFGRERDIVTLQENLTRLHTNSIVILYGQRRSGKTTLMLHLQQSAILANHLSIFINMQELAYQMSANKFLFRLAQSLVEALRQKGVSVPTRTVDDFADDPCEVFRTFLKEIEPHLQKRRVIIMLDEFEVLEEQVRKGTLEPEFLQFLRHLMQFHPYLNFLLSGTHTIEELTRDYWSVFFNMAYHHQLSKLDEHSATRLIVEPVELDYAASAVRKIRMLTGDQPYLIHLICHILVQYCNNHKKAYVTINDVNTVLQDAMITGHIHFNYIWDQFSSPEQLSLAMLANIGREEGRAVSLVEIEGSYRHHQITTKRENLLTTLKLLSKADVIEHITDAPADLLEQALAQGRLRYTIPVGLLRRWLLREKPIELLLKDARPILSNKHE